MSYSVRFSRVVIGELRAAAEQRGVGVTQLMREWIEQRLAEEQARAGQEHVAALTAHLRAALDDAEQLSRHRPAR